MQFFLYNYYKHHNELLTEAEQATPTIRDGEPRGRGDASLLTGRGAAGRGDAVCAPC